MNITSSNNYNINSNIINNMNKIYNIMNMIII